MSFAVLLHVLDSSAMSHVIQEEEANCSNVMANCYARVQESF